MDFVSSVDQNTEYGKELIKKSLEELSQKRFDECQENLMRAQNIFRQERSADNISTCLSLSALSTYFKSPKAYLKALGLLSEGEYLANRSDSVTPKLVNELVSAHINYAEKNTDLALIQYTNAQKFAQTFDEFSLLESINTQIAHLTDSVEKNSQAPQAIVPQQTPPEKDPLLSLVKIGQAISAQTHIDGLLSVIAQETKAALNADRCSVFLLDKDTNELWSKVALGMDSQEIRFPADKGLAGHVVQTGEVINIKDAYNDERFNKDIDLQTGYHTKNILCLPIKNINQEIVGAFQVLNKTDGDFTKIDEELLFTIGSSASIAIDNARLFEKQQEMYKEQKETFNSFIDTLATSIDARDRITAGHSTRVRMYSSLIAKAFNMDEKAVEIIEKAAILHDIGKIGIRDSVLQKDGKLTDEEYAHIQEHARITHDILEKIHMSKDFQQITEIASSHHEKYNGSGYYRHISGEEIPFGGRILAVADVFDAITSKRHYRDKMPIVNVVDILLRDSQTHFDKLVVDKFLEIKTVKLIDVFLTENKLEMKPDDRALFENYNLRDVYEISKDDFASDAQKSFLNLFNLYYNYRTPEEGAENAQ